MGLSPQELSSSQWIHLAGQEETAGSGTGQGPDTHKSQKRKSTTGPGPFVSQRGRDLPTSLMMSLYMPWASSPQHRTVEKVQSAKPLGSLQEGGEKHPIRSKHATGRFVSGHQVCKQILSQRDGREVRSWQPRRPWPQCRAYCMSQQARAWRLKSRGASHSNASTHRPGRSGRCPVSFPTLPWMVRGGHWPGTSSTQLSGASQCCLPTCAAFSEAGPVHWGHRAQRELMPRVVLRTGQEPGSCT